MIVLDTNVLVRLITKDDIEQTRQAAALLAGSGPFWIDRVVLLETGWVLRSRYGYPTSAIARALRLAVALDNAEIEHRPRCDEALRLYESGLDLGDAFILAFAPAGATVATFDDRFAKRASAMGGAGVRLLGEVLEGIEG